ncbi:DNA polymerase III subunit beta [Pedobacter sp. Hv1]|uniref:DNA polymerase III subunit beta n=1 Tax=Pedobacter sp. Hv1 TaxID=1740090 RepID=UPI0006D8BFB8|nr:DNA polymerase III subunit beta [Pedobacter sp. Hv1]KQC02065.1 hypothetical protein AQF98_00385 [Pedobacter sp. Hv1]
MKHKFTVQKSILLDALTITGKGISNSILPILQSYLFKVEDDYIFITAGNMEVFLTTKVDISGNKFSRSFAIPAKRLLDWVKELPEQGIEFNLQDNLAVITTGNAKCTIPIEDGNNFPLIDITDPTVLEISSESLMLGIDRSLFACSLDVLRPSLTGVLIEFENREISFTGCDTHVLGTYSQMIETKLEDRMSFIIPNKVMTILRSLTCAENLKICIGKRSIQFETDEKTVVQSMLIDDSYPDWRGILPLKNDRHFFIQKDLLYGSVKRVRQFSNFGTSLIDLEIGDNKCKVSAKNEIGENADEDILLDYPYEPLKICVNGNKLISCLSKYGTELVHFSIKDGKHGIIIREDNENLTDKSNLMLLMPFYVPE